ncbi:MAG TPA: putative glycoside hydrolase [Anaerovoracaceae bacterium]|nr:putative glycoside hydrolase [Anaerovoracaceae bacterium]
MKKNNLLAILVLSSSIILAGCPDQSLQTQGSEYNVQDDAKIVDSVKTPEEIRAEQLKAREELEAQRKAELGEFYVSLPPLDQEPILDTVKAKALYLTANVAGFDFSAEDIDYYADYIRAVSGQSGKPADASRLDSVNKLEKALGICKATEINALVIDVKNDSGVVAWSSDIGIVNQISSNASAPIKNYEKLMNYLRENDIYRIARIVAFKDPYFAEVKSNHAIQLKAGGVYKDYSGMMWVNPFDEYVWKYLLAVSKEAALRGFQEIQYDYVRFPDDAKKYNPITEFPGRNGRDKDEGIEDFLKFAESELEPYNVHLSADVFGIITHSWDDKPEDIGQTWRKIANHTDYICPMVYPSHYGTGLYGFNVPDQHPYEVVRLAMQEALERNAAEKDPAIIRPWVQGFDAPWIKGHIRYDAETISEQLIAGMELGIDEYIVWNASNNYDPMTFFYQGRIKTDVRTSGEDILVRAPETALMRYLDAERDRRYSILYLLTPVAERPEDYDIFVSEGEKDQTPLKKYEILSTSKNEDGTFTASVNAEYTSGSGITAENGVQYKIILEKDVYKVIKP